MSFLRLLWRDLRAAMRSEGDALPIEWRRRLRWTNPRLRELDRRYSAFGGAAVADAVWAPEFVSSIDLRRFRDDGPFVWQKATPNLDEAALRASFEFLAAEPPAAELLSRLEEDGAFGARTVAIDGRRVSRDLLDSVSELSFLDRHLGLARGAVRNVIDVGAGYGRLAHRASRAFPKVRWHSTDAIAASTFLSETYLAFRAVAKQAPVVPLDELEAALGRERFELAVNVHSFSECTPAAIDWWLARLAAAGLPKLFLAPNAVSADGREPLTNRGESMAPALALHGWELGAVEPKYADPETQRRGLSPTAYFLYFSERG